VGVSKSQPTRWQSGEETPSPRSQAVLADLYNVITQFEMVWPSSMLRNWLDSPNAHLGDRSPLTVFQVEGGAPLLLALRAEAAGAHA